jgi:heme/copper-type cytochrome/quinol oxidase subunit 2
MTDPVVPPATPAPVPVATAAVPGKGLGIAGLILAIFLPIIGLIVSIIARSQSKRAGFSNGPATAGIVIGILFTIFAIIGGIIAGVSSANLLAQCAELGPGTYGSLTCS